MTKQQGGGAALTLENIGEILTVAEAAAATKLSVIIIRNAILSGELKGFIPGNRDRRWPGRGMGYRVQKAALQAWFFGAMRGES